MRGLWVDGTGLRVREDLERPPRSGHPERPPRSGYTERAREVAVRVHLAGVCATDLALVAGYMGFRGTPGHEFVGTALAGPLAGRRVVGEINAGCGVCARCSAGDARHCPARSVLGILGRPGAFAEELALPAENLLAVPDGVSDEAAVFCEPLAAALAIAEQVDLARVGRALVIGDGRLGLLVAHVLAAHEIEVTLAGRHPERAALVPAGVRHACGPCEPGAPRPADAERFELVVEATGRPEVLPRALEWARPRGTVVLKTTSERPCALDLAPLVIDEISLVGSRCGRLEPALDWLARGRVPVERLIDARFPLARADLALACAARGGTLKVLIENDRR